MTNDEIKLELQTKLEGSDMLVCKDVIHANFKPHPFCIRTRHVKHASEHFGGVLGDEAIKSAEKAGIYCATPGCNITYAQHTADRLALFQLKRDCSNDEVSTILKGIMIPYEGILDGMTFVETEAKYRVK